MKINLLLKGKKVLVTGGAGFIGSNLCEYLLSCNALVRCLDNFSTGRRDNISSFLRNKNFELIEGDITNLIDCQNACKGMNFVLHQAALGSVPRSIKDPISSNSVNIGGFLNMLVASRDNKIERFVYAASSSTYGDSKSLPKIENKIGKPLSPYAITKYVNELYAEIFFKTYKLNSVGLRYFNVFGRRQDPNGAYAAVIPKFVLSLLSHQDLIINGDGSYSRDFTYIDNVIQMNILALTTLNKNALNQVYNTAYGERTTLMELVNHLKSFLFKYDNKIKDVNVIHGPLREGDIPHSLASIEKAKNNLEYQPTHDFEKGLYESVDWYWKNLK